MAFWTDVAAIETVDRITAVARRRGWRVETYSRSDSRVVLELVEPGHGCCGRVDIKRNRRGSIDIHNRSRRTRFAISTVLVTVAVVLLVAALALAVLIWGACREGECDMWAERGRGIVLLVAFIGAGFGVALSFLVTWIWRPSRRRCLDALDALLDETRLAQE